MFWVIDDIIIYMQLQFFPTGKVHSRAWWRHEII